MSRRMVAPGIWLDEGPRPVHMARSAYSVGAFTGPAMVPVMHHASASPLVHENLKRGPYLGTLCGRLMPIAKTVCARSVGHRDSCRSRAVLDAQTSSRRVG